MEAPGKKILAGILLILLNAPAVFVSYWQISQCRLHDIMESLLECARLETITMDTRDAVWIVPGKEILVQGRYFDVKSVTQTGNILLCTGLFDDQEETIANNLSAASGAGDQEGPTGKWTVENPGGQKPGLALGENFSPEFLSADAVASITPASQPGRMLLQFNQHSLLSACTMPATPPPRIS